MVKYMKGKVILATVTGIAPYGIFVTLDEYYSGLIHISEISRSYVKSIGDYVTIGEDIYVEILEIDDISCHLKLSIKNINYKIKNKRVKRKIVETAHGFATLKYKLPIWLEENKKKLK